MNILFIWLHFKIIFWQLSTSSCQLKKIPNKNIKYIIFYYNTFAHLYIFVLFFTALQQWELILREIFVQIIQMMQTIRMVLKMASFSSYIFFLSWNVVKSRCPVRSVESSRAKKPLGFMFFKMQWHVIMQSTCKNPFWFNPALCLSFCYVCNARFPHACHIYHIGSLTFGL